MGNTEGAKRRWEVQRGQDPLPDRSHKGGACDEDDDRDFKQGEKDDQLQKRGGKGDSKPKEYTMLWD